MLLSPFDRQALKALSWLLVDLFIPTIARSDQDKVFASSILTSIFFREIHVLRRIRYYFTVAHSWPS